jgi:uncharacterized protein YndB with AHSA1/START domain
MVTQVGALVVRRSMHIKASPERIWKEFASAERFRAWWSTQRPDRDEEVLEYEPRVGGTLRMRITSDRHDPIDVDCTVTVMDAAREFAFEMTFVGAGWEAPTLVTIRLTPHGDGTLVELAHSGFERIGPAAVEQFNAFEGGWDLRELEGLRAAVEA